MFKNIKIEKGLVHGGKIFKFESGETAILGANGCGKSVLIEYLAFSLFGAVALRDKVTNYKNLEVVTDVVIKGKSYQIKRNLKDCTILDENGVVVCVGTKTCNLKIITLLGYDYNVYKMGNYAEQLDILGMGKLKPAERKAALDKTLGIGVIDKLVKYTNDQALKYKHEVEGLRFAIQDPGQEPEQPTGYEDSNILAVRVNDQKKLLDEYNSFSEMEVPQKPEEPIFPEGLEGWTGKSMFFSCL